MMLRPPHTIRWLFTAVLAVSTSIAAFVPLWAESTPVTARPSAEASATTCCCETQSGDCCGMGCCSAKNAPVPKRNPSPTPDDGVNSRIGALALVWSQVSVPAKLLGGCAWHRSGVVLDRSQSEATLQAQHVRLDA